MGPSFSPDPRCSCPFWRDPWAFGGHSLRPPMPNPCPPLISLCLCTGCTVSACSGFFVLWSHTVCGLLLPACPLSTVFAVGPLQLGPAPHSFSHSLCGLLVLYPPPPIPMYSMKWGKLAVVWFSVHAFSLYPLWSLLRGPAVAPFLSTNLLPVSRGSRPRTEGVPSCRSGLCRCPGICGLTSGAGRREEGRGQFGPWGFPGFA